MDSRKCISLGAVFVLLTIGLLVPLTTSAQGPSIDLVKTVGTVPAVCAPTNNITVSTGTTVYYCYEVTNTGTVTFEFHTLEDDVLGTIFTNVPVTLAPGASYQHIEPFVVPGPVTNTGTWTAVDAIGGYTIDDTITYDFEDITTTGTSFTLGDDDTSILPIGFTFDFYGMSYTNIEVSSNGFLSVNAAGASGCCTGQSLPDPATPNGVIAGWWEDLDPDGFPLYYETLGTAPNQYLAISFIDIPHFPSGTLVTMQYKLFEDGTIEVHYLDAPSDGGTHSAGIENQDGSIGLQYYIGTAALPGTPIAVQYTPAQANEAMASDMATVDVSDPDIDFTPASFFSAQLADTVVVQSGTLSNLGTADLDWNILEAEPVELPASDGTFPRGTAEPSIERAPSFEPDPAYVASLEGRQVRGETAFGTYFDLGSFLSYVGSFDVDVPGSPTTILEVFPFYPGADFVANDFSTLYALDADSNQLVAIDVATGAATPIGSSTPSGSWTGAAGDPTTGVLYGCSAACGTESYLYTIDTSTGAATLVGSMGASATCAIGIAINSSGEMYGYDIVSDSLISIDKTTGVATTIGSLGYDANYSQGCDFDETTDTLYLAAYNNATGVGELRVADTTTGNTTVVGLFGPTGAQEWNTMAIAAGGACSNPSDVPWLSISPTSGTTAPAGSDTVDVTFDSTGIPLGLFEAVICIESNDPDEPLLEIPATMEVIIPVELQSFTIE
jgi:hypothetical protein